LAKGLAESRQNWFSRNFERGNKPSDLNVLRRLGWTSGTDQQTEFAVWFVFTAVGRGQQSKPCPVVCNFTGFPKAMS
jgi:hypothetical protein